MSYIKRELAWHGETLRLVLRSALPAAAIFPLLAAGLVWLASDTLLHLFYGKYAWTGKDLQEIIGPSFVGAATAVGLFLFLQQQRYWLGWLTLLCASFLCRELHFQGTSTGVYIAVVTLLIAGSLRRDFLWPLLSSRLSSSLLCGTFGVYAVAVSVDQGLWKFLPNERMWGLNVEETLESCGHALLLMAVLSTVLIRARQHVAETATTIPLFTSDCEPSKPELEIVSKSAA